VRVAYLTTLEDGGPLAHLVELSPRVAEAGADVVVLCASESVARRFTARGVDAVVAPVRSKWDLLGALRLSRGLGRVDVLHSHDRRALLVGSMLARRSGARVVHTCHGLPEELADRLGRPPAESPDRGPLPARARLRAEAWLGRRAAWVVPSRAMADFLSLHGLQRTRITVLPSRIDRRRDEPGPAHTPFAVGTAGRLARHKGIDLLVSACARSGVPLRLHLFGDGPLRASLEEQARREGVDAVFHGAVADVRARIEQLDLYVQPSRGDNLPVAVLEAMAAALPVVGTRVGGIPELVVDGATGVLVDLGDISAIAAAIGDFAADDARRRCAGRRAAARVDECFAARDAGPAMLELYERACASST
jgi:glycosyltransferase involved in cell wall biosynthesis